VKAVQVKGTLTNENEDWRLFWGRNLIFSDFFHCQKLPRIGWTFKGHIQQSIQQTISVKTGRKSSKPQSQSQLDWFLLLFRFVFCWAQLFSVTQKFEFWTEQVIYVSKLFKYKTFVGDLISQNFEQPVYLVWFVYFVSL
jgi:hypothetical protein